MFDSLKKVVTIAGNDGISPDSKKRPSPNPGIRKRGHFS
jgi:hypothetical protein